jgi:hypothetical protein
MKHTFFAKKIDGTLGITIIFGGFELRLFIRTNRTLH